MGVAKVRVVCVVAGPEVHGAVVDDDRGPPGDNRQVPRPHLVVQLGDIASTANARVHVRHDAVGGRQHVRRRQRRRSDPAQNAFGTSHVFVRSASGENGHQRQQVVGSEALGVVQVADPAVQVDDVHGMARRPMGTVRRDEIRCLVQGASTGARLEEVPDHVAVRPQPGPCELTEGAHGFRQEPVLGVRGDHGRQAGRAPVVEHAFGQVDTAAVRVRQDERAANRIVLPEERPRRIRLQVLDSGQVARVLVRGHERNQNVVLTHQRPLHGVPVQVGERGTIPRARLHQHDEGGRVNVRRRRPEQVQRLVNQARLGIHAEHVLACPVGDRHPGRLHALERVDGDTQAPMAPVRHDHHVEHRRRRCRHGAPLQEHPLGGVQRPATIVGEHQRAGANVVQQSRPLVRVRMQRPQRVQVPAPAARVDEQREHGRVNGDASPHHGVEHGHRLTGAIRPGEAGEDQRVDLDPRRDVVRLHQREDGRGRVKATMRE